MTEEVTTEKPKYEIEKITAVEATVNALVKQFHGIVYDVTTTKGMETAKKDRALLVKARTTLEQARKEEKADVIERGKFIDATALKIKETILQYEEPLDKQIKDEEERKERERRDRFLKEQERVAAIQKRIDMIKNAPLVAVTKTAGEIKIAINAITKITIDNSFQEFEPVAQEVKDDTLVKMQEILTDKIAAEEEILRQEEKRKQEEKDLQLQREKLAAERAKMEEEQRERDRQNAEQAAQAERELAERRAQLESEAEAERAKLAAERAEQEKEAYRIAEEQKKAQAAKEEAERAERLRLEAEKAEAELKALAKKADAMAKKLADPVSVIQMCYDAAINEKMTDSHKVAMIKGLLGAYLERIKG